MLNNVTIMGRMVRDPEIRASAAGVSWCSFFLAVDRDFSGNSGEKETDFIDCVAWRHNAEFIGKYFRKGDMMVVSGRLQTRVYTDQEGVRRKSSTVAADGVYFGGSKRKAQGDGQQNAGGGQMPQGQDYAAIEDDDAHLPF